jgi:uncharacterized FlgJ-related protein
MKFTVMICAMLMSGAAMAQSMDTGISRVDSAFQQQEASDLEYNRQQAAIAAAAAAKAQARQDHEEARNENYIDKQMDMDLQERRTLLNRENDIIDSQIRKSDNESRRQPSYYIIN